MIFWSSRQHIMMSASFTPVFCRTTTCQRVVPSSLKLIFLWTTIRHVQSTTISRSADECPDLSLPQHLKKFYINGSWVSPKSESTKSWDVINPSFGHVIAQISMGSADDAEVAIRSAKAAQASWSETALSERRAYVEKLLTIYRRRRE